MLFSASRTQKVISLSSAEAEVYAASSGSSDAILLSRILTWISNKRTSIYIYTDSSGAKGILQRRGVGRLRHLSCRILWLQDLVSGGNVKLCSISGHLNPADLGTKRLSAARMKSFMSILGLFNKGTKDLEGADDPGRIFVRKLNVKALACALSLLQVQLQGCDGGDEPNDQSSRLVFTLLIGAMIFGFWFGQWWNAPQPAVDHVPQQDEPAMVDEHGESTREPGDFSNMAQIGQLTAAAQAEQFQNALATSSSTSALPASSTHGAPAVDEHADSPESTSRWSPEAMLTYMYSRCQRRLQVAETETRRAMYRERMQILRDVMASCRSNDESVRVAATHMANNMSDLSPDADSPTNHMSWIGFCNMMDEVQTAVNVGQQIATLAQQAQAGLLDPVTTSGSNHVDAVADALMGNISFPNQSTEDAEEEDEDSDECMETESQRHARYSSSQMCEVSDIDEWMEMHHGNSEDENSDEM